MYRRSFTTDLKSRRLGIRPPATRPIAREAQLTPRWGAAPAQPGFFPKLGSPSPLRAQGCALSSQMLIIACNPDDSVVDGIYVLNKAGFRHLVVAQDGKPVGVLSMRDILKNIAPLLLDSKNRHEEQLLVKFLQALKAA